MKNKQGLRLVKGTVSQQQAKENIYIGNKIKHSISNLVQKGGAYRKRFGGEGGCGCSQNPKQIMGSTTKKY